MNNDTNPLQERIARAIDPSSWRLHDSGPFPPEHQASQAVIRRSLDDAAAVLPIIRAAQADAWDEGWRQGAFLGVTTSNPYRATEYETGDRA